MPTIQITPQFVDLPGGIKLYTERVHSTQRVQSNSPHTIIMIHGLGGTTSLYHPIYASILASSPASTILAYDQSGQGLSAISPSHLKGGSNPLSHDILRDELDALISTAAPTGPLTLVGHSAGTILVAHFIVSSSPNVARVKNAILIAAPIGTPDTPMIDSMRDTVLRTIEERGIPAIVEQVCIALTGTTTREKRPLAAALMRCALLLQSKEGYAAHMRSGLDFRKNLKFPFEKFPESLRVLIVGGDEDLFVPAAESVALGEKIPHSQVFVIPGVGHSPHVEVPEEFVSIVTKFLTQVGYGVI
ncbi:hypothetical protein QCA50_006137 [Cerrena zonata]|uniref:AB hydrolase-1 domain-containing protein n=1 Tax=Cerrena zonata TaxID=2478898 RepID=A0AAW0GH02_9APHY